MPLKSRLTRSPVIALLLLSALLWVFVHLARGVVSGVLRDFDAALLLAMRTPGDLSDPIGAPWLEEMARDFSALGSVGILTLILVGAFGALWLSGRRRSAWVLLGAVTVAALTSQMLKAGFDRPRPDIVPHGSFVSNASFPSGHTLMAAALYPTLGMIVARASPRLALRVFAVSVAVVIAVLVGLSRIYLGVHWPTDVLAGWTLGAAIALIAVLMPKP